MPQVQTSHLEPLEASYRKMTIGRIPSVEGGIQPTIFTTKGDILVATANATVTRQGVGSDGQVLTADSTQADGITWSSVATPYAAGKNKIINGDFYWNQRNFTSTTTTNTYGYDRWQGAWSGGTVTYSAQTFTLGNGITGYEPKNYARIVTSGQSAAGDLALFYQAIESVRTFANQTVTYSFWAKASSGTPKLSIETEQSFGSGGSPSAVTDTYQGQVTLSTSWQRYSVTFTVPSISGKTIGTNNNDCLSILMWVSAGSTFNSRTNSIGIQNNTFDIWGVQLEAGSVATPFQTATGTIQGELAACQRYYFRNTSADSGGQVGAIGSAQSTTNVRVQLQAPVPMRKAPTTVDYSTLMLDDNNAGYAVSSVTIYSSGTWGAYLNCAATGLTQYRFHSLINNANTAGYVGLSAEL